MDSDRPFVIALSDAGTCGETIIGGKAAKLAQLTSAGFNVPQGFCITAWAYESFLVENEIATTIRMELGRKSMDDMRWEEIWDAALRIRTLFLSHKISKELHCQIDSALNQLDASKTIAVRSSAPGEDAEGTSFAGLHESIIGVNGSKAVHDAVRLVWASLWSDAALLYRRELQLDPAHSRMAVLVQEMVDADRSGVAFGCDPRDGNKERAIIETVPGPCSLLVDGVTDPDRWELDRRSRQVVVWLPGEREDETSKEPLLTEHDLHAILDTLSSVEDKFLWTADMEWTGRSDEFTVLQARPVTTGTPDTDEKRSWYLTLRLDDVRLRDLRQRVAEELIPQLEAEGQELAAEELDLYDDEQLANAIDRRSEAVERWKKIYWDDFIPFAHGVRRLATYYNDAVQPEDPYEFVGLLRDQPLIAVRRNKAIMNLADQVSRDEELLKALNELLDANDGPLDWTTARNALHRANGENAQKFITDFELLTEQFLDVAFDQGRLDDNISSLLRNILELARGASEATLSATKSDSTTDFEQRLLEAVGGDRHDEATEMIETGRISWKLRDDDNLLVARLESQLLRALEVAEKRLRVDDRLVGERHSTAGDSGKIVNCLRNPSTSSIELEVRPTELQSPLDASDPGETPRQLIGQPASPGIATGRVRCIRRREDLGNFRRGEILVCDAIQPTMTHLVPLASAIVERRGGMLIHGAIIARELGIPCVNGVRSAAELLTNGDLVTIDGHLGIVTLGAAEFDLEL